MKLPRVLDVSELGRWRQKRPSEIAQTIILVCAAFLWAWSAVSTWHDLIGHPRDAPFLRIPGHFRAITFWLLPAAWALYSAFTGKRVVGAFWALSVGSVVRLGSYIVSWVASWPWLDTGIPHSFLWGYAPRFIYGHGIPDDELKGDPHAYGSGWIYAAILIGLAGLLYLVGMCRRYEDKVIRLEVELSNRRMEGRDARSE